MSTYTLAHALCHAAWMCTALLVLPSMGFLVARRHWATN